MAGSNALQQPDESLVNELRSTLCLAIYLLDMMQRKAQDDAAQEAASLERLARSAIAQMKADRFVNRVLRMHPPLVQAFAERLLDPMNVHRQPHNVLADLGHDMPRMTAHRFAKRFRDTAAKIANQGPADAADEPKHGIEGVR